MALCVEQKPLWPDRRPLLRRLFGGPYLPAYRLSAAQISRVLHDAERMNRENSAIWRGRIGKITVKGASGGP